MAESKTQRTESESFIQADIVKNLRLAGFFCHSVPNEQSHSNPVRTGQLISMGLFPGTADLIVWLGNGQIAYLEVKTDKGKQSERQIVFEQKCKNAGYPYAVVRSAQEALDFVATLENTLENTRKFFVV